MQDKRPILGGQVCWEEFETMMAEGAKIIVDSEAFESRYLCSHSRCSRMTCVMFTVIVYAENIWIGAWNNAPRLDNLHLKLAHERLHLNTTFQYL